MTNLHGLTQFVPHVTDTPPYAVVTAEHEVRRGWNTTGTVKYAHSLALSYCVEYTLTRICTSCMSYVEML